MKAPSPKLLLEECAALSVPFLGALAELTIRNGYHQISAEPTRFVYLACLIAFSLGAALATEFGRLDGAARQSVRSANRVLGLAAWAWIVGIRGVALTDWLDGAPATTRVVTIAGMAALVWLAFDELRWRRARPALLLAASL